MNLSLIKAKYASHASSLSFLLCSLKGQPSASDVLVWKKQQEKEKSATLNKMQRLEEMAYKVCTRCHQEKLIKEFIRKRRANSYKETEQEKCNECANKDKAYRKKLKEKSPPEVVIVNQENKENELFGGSTLYKWQSKPIVRKHGHRNRI